MSKGDFSPLEQRLLDGWQRDFPLSSTPYADIAESLGVSEDEVLVLFRDLQKNEAISRIGGVFKPGTVGASTLAAMEVPDARLDQVADLVSSFDEVNHNYEREHRLNLWFVVTAEDGAAVARVLKQIEDETGLKVLDLPMLEAFHLDLGFKLKWDETTQTTD